MNANEIDYFDLMSTLVVTGTNPEMADMTNPCGATWGVRAAVVAVAHDGRRRSKSFGTFDNQAAADREGERWVRWCEGDLLGGHLPEDFTEWTEVDPVYGSEAYVRKNVELKLICWERELEESYRWR